jgi:hypothetical protein
MNSRTIGVVLVGDYDLTHPSPEAVDAATHLVRYLREAYGTSTVLFHADVKATACPGIFAKAALNGLKSQ